MLRPRPLLPALLALALAIAGLLGPGATACFACSCLAGRSVDDDVAEADAVFTATVTESADPATGPTYSSADPVYYTVAVDRVYAGRVGARTTVVSARDGAACGAELVTGEDYVFFARPAEAGAWRVGLCGGTRPTADLPLVEAITGAGRAPAADVPSPHRVTPDDDKDALGWPAPLIVGPVALLILATGWVVLRQRSRRDERAAGRSTRHFPAA